MNQAVPERPLLGEVKFWSGSKRTHWQSASQIVRVIRNQVLLGIPAGLIRVGDMGGGKLADECGAIEFFTITKIERRGAS